MTTALYEVYEKAPEIIMLDPLEDIIEKNLKGPSSYLLIETGQLFVNGLYNSALKTIDRIVSASASPTNTGSVSAAVRSTTS